MCAFHVKSPEIVTPKSLASLTNLMHSSPMTTGGKSQSDVKLMRSSLHLSVFNLTLFLIDQFTTSFTIPWASLCCPFFITSDVVVSSTYFQIEALLTVRSFIMIKKVKGLVWSLAERPKVLCPIRIHSLQRVWFSVSELIGNLLSN